FLERPLRDEARVVLVDVELPVEAEELRVRAQEALDVRLRRQHRELLVLERANVLRTDLRRELDLRVVEALPDARFTEAVADLEHRPSLGVSGEIVVVSCGRAVQPHRTRATDTIPPETPRFSPPGAEGARRTRRRSPPRARPRCPRPRGTRPRGSARCLPRVR